MLMKVTNSIIIVTIINFFKLVQTETTEDITNPVAKDNHNALLNQILTIKEIMAQLDTDVAKLHNGIDQQANIIYGDWLKDTKVDTNLSPEVLVNQSEILENCYNNFNIKLLNINEDIEAALRTQDNLLWNKTVRIARTIESMHKCLLPKQANYSTDSHTKASNILEKLNKYIARCDILKDKIVNLNKQERVLEKSSENLSKILAEISSKLDSQNEYFENLEKQLPVLQGASKTLDDYIIRKNEHHSYYERCRDTGNCHRRHHFRHSY